MVGKCDWSLFVPLQHQEIRRFKAMRHKSTGRDPRTKLTTSRSKSSGTGRKERSRQPSVTMQHHRQSTGSSSSSSDRSDDGDDTDSGEGYKTNVCCAASYCLFLTSDA